MWICWKYCWSVGSSTVLSAVTPALAAGLLSPTAVLLLVALPVPLLAVAVATAADPAAVYTTLHLNLRSHSYNEMFEL